MNPNVSPDLLIKLAGQFPKQVFNNPAIDLLLIVRNAARKHLENKK